jgi:hypothetical protein
MGVCVAVTFFALGFLAGREHLRYQAETAWRELIDEYQRNVEREWPKALQEFQETMDRLLPLTPKSK